MQISNLCPSCPGEEDEGVEIYWQTEKTCRKYTKFMTIFFLISINMAYFMLFFNSIYSVIVGNYDTTTWPALFDLALPFDTVVLWGWYLKWFILTVMDISYVLGMVSATTYFLCCCLYIQAMCDYYDFLINSVQQIFTQGKSTRDNQISNQSYRKMMTTAHKAVEAHVDIFE